jgi:hypothetical protein
MEQSKHNFHSIQEMMQWIDSPNSAGWKVMSKEKEFTADFNNIQPCDKPNGSVAL